ncbi:hypothetical protein CSV75_08630 [Sporosarcina sp. P18a]|uniref:hypothetical protein n=1 Tax=Sporosarcina sp. P18a TaxID=2048259 RepID=UPI000C16F0DE|nr:hypothetical protein [Sporosarcina sp. P18a]PIC80025.1 hypothetical protein CSV75_08630 [Sporosarcina sp. P18a]
MFDYTALPGSSGYGLSEERDQMKGIYYTALEGRDERRVYNELNERLTCLETDTTLHEADLATIEEDASAIIISIELIEEIQLRMDWMNRLYEVRHSLSSTNTLSDMERLRSLIAPVQTCPLKALLTAELENRITSLLVETKQIKKSAFDELMEQAIEQAGEGFINLGAAGRAHVVEKLLVDPGVVASIDMVQQASTDLERQVTELHDAVSIEDLLVKLEALPLAAFTLLSEEEKGVVASKLEKASVWQGLASLNQMIDQLDRTDATLKELEVTKSEYGKIATAFDVSKLDSGKIRYH